MKTINHKSQNEFGYKIISILIFLLIASILPACKKNKFTFSPQSQNNPPLMLSGYYDHTYKINNDSLHHEIIFLYTNGVVLFASSAESRLSERESEFRNGKYHDAVKNSKNDWGPFKINDGILEFQRWFPAENAPVHFYTCKILNNQSFEIYQTGYMVRGKKNQTRNISEVYTFKAFAPKPDSTNQYVK